LATSSDSSTSTSDFDRDESEIIPSDRQLRSHNSTIIDDASERRDQLNDADEICATAEETADASQEDGESVSAQDFHSESVQARFEISDKVKTLGGYVAVI
jgi:hypothetical protein